MSLAGCTTARPHCCPINVHDELVGRTAQQMICVQPGECIVPEDASLSDGVTEDEAIAIALSNNSAFQALLMQIVMAQGDVAQARLLTNPNLLMLIPVSVKQWEWTLYLPLEAFVTRPYRTSLAEGDYQRIAEQLVQNGLNLVRDVRVAHADLALAIEQRDLAKEAVTIRQDIADVTDRRHQLGEISELEAMTARIDALNAVANAASLEQNVTIARSRLVRLMGLQPTDDELLASWNEPTPLAAMDVSQWVDEAIANRPDVQASEWGIETARQRAELSHWLFLRADAVVDANGTGPKGFEIGPGLRFDIPIFNRNQGGIMRADAEVVQAMYNRDAIVEQVVQEVRSAAAQYFQARDNYSLLKDQIVPSLEEALAIAKKGYSAGGAPYLLVLQTTTQYLDAKGRQLDQLASMLRARAELERSIGRNLTDIEELPSTTPTMPEDEHR